MQKRSKLAIKMRKNAPRGVLLILLATALAFAPGLACPPRAWADGQAQVTVGSPGEVDAHAEFSVPVTIESNPGFAAAVLAINYDTSALQLVGISDDGILSAGQLNNIGSNAVGYLSTQDNKKNGLLFTLTFRALPAANGVYDIAVALKDGTEKNLTSINGSSVPVEFAPARVTVAGAGGDTNTNTPQTPGAGTGTTPGTGGQAGTGTSASQNTGHTVNVVGSAGEVIDLLVRAAVSGDGNEVSFDQGQTWQRVPKDGVVTSPQGQRIQLSEDANTATVISAETPRAGGEEGLSLLLVAGIIAGIVIVAAALAFVVVRSRRRKQSATERDMAVGRHARG